MRSATQSVWYHWRGIGLFFVSGAAGVPAGLGLEQPGEAVQVLGMVLLEPTPVVRDGMVAPGGRVHGLLGPLEAAPGAGVAPGDPGVLLELVLRVEAGLEVRLAQQRGAVAGRVVQVLRHGRRVDREGNAVGHHAVRPHVLARQHGRPRRHAHRVLVVGPAVVDALGGQAVDDGRAGHRPAVAAEAVVALLVGGDEEDVAATLGRSRERLQASTAPFGHAPAVRHSPVTSLVTARFLSLLGCAGSSAGPLAARSLCSQHAVQVDLELLHQPGEELQARRGAVAPPGGAGRRRR